MRNLLLARRMFHYVTNLSSRSACAYLLVHMVVMDAVEVPIDVGHAQQ